MEVNRRDFLKIIGIGGTTAAMAGCGAQPPESLIPYVVPPEEIIPGEATWYATVCRECPAGCRMPILTALRWIPYCASRLGVLPSRTPRLPPS